MQMKFFIAFSAPRETASYNHTEFLTLRAGTRVNSLFADTLECRGPKSSDNTYPEILALLE
jgi:hypothetical protein